jgi:hypothetical protein
LCEHSGEVCVAIGVAIVVSLILYMMFMVHTLLGIGGIGLLLIVVGANLIED